MSTKNTDNSNISYYKFTFNQTINCQISQKNLLLLMLSFTITFVTIKGSIDRFHCHARVPHQKNILETVQ